MLFDKLCGIAEAHLDPRLRGVVEKSRLFIFESDKPPTIEELLTEEGCAYWTRAFSLPFPTVAIETPSEVRIAEAFVPQVGLPQQWMFFWFRDWPRDLAAMDFPNAKGTVYSYMWATFLLRELRPVPEEWELLYDIGLGERCFFTKTQLLDSRPFHPEDEESARWAGMSLISGLGNLLHVVTSRDRFILEERPDNGVRKPAKGRIPRAHERPIYTVLHPDAIRRRMGLPSRSEDKSSPRPHERRGHYRYYAHERFSEEVRSKPRWIQPTWVGPAESAAHGKRYRVILDAGRVPEVEE